MNRTVSYVHMSAARLWSNLTIPLRACQVAPSGRSLIERRPTSSNVRPLHPQTQAYQFSYSSNDKPRCFLLLCDDIVAASWKHNMGRAEKT
eukprot:6463522-Amphidinium_carterae.1